jgi:hypothetical protein
MKSVSIILLTIFLSMSHFGSSFAQEWEPPFEFETNFLSFPLPDDHHFNDFDSALVILKVQFHEKENRISWFDLMRVDMFKNDSLAYNYFNTEINSDWRASDKKTNNEVYPDSITIKLVHYLDVVKDVEFEPTKYAEEYRLVPVSVPVRLKPQRKPAY